MTDEFDIMIDNMKYSKVVLRKYRSPWQPKPVENCHYALIRDVQLWYCTCFKSIRTFSSVIPSSAKTANNASEESLRTMSSLNWDPMPRGKIKVPSDFSFCISVNVDCTSSSYPVTGRNTIFLDDGRAPCLSENTSVLTNWRACETLDVEFDLSIVTLDRKDENSTGSYVELSQRISFTPEEKVSAETWVWFWWRSRIFSLWIKRSRTPVCK